MSKNLKVPGIARNACLLACVLAVSFPLLAQSPGSDSGLSSKYPTSAIPNPDNVSRSVEYGAVQKRLASGWNTWDVNSVTTHVLLPEGLAIHVAMKHNSTEFGDAFLGDTLIGRLSSGAEQVFPGPHAWDGSYTDLRVAWKSHSWRVQSAHDGRDLVILVTPLASESSAALPPTAVFSVNYLWNSTGTVERRPGVIRAVDAAGAVTVYCTCETGSNQQERHPLRDPHCGPVLCGRSHRARCHQYR